MISTQLKFLASMRSGDFIDGADIQTEGSFPVYGGNGLRGYTNRCTHSVVAPLIGRQGALCGNVNFAIGEFYATEHAIVATPKAGIHPRWLHWTLISLNLGQYSMAAAQPGLSVDVIEKVRTFKPAFENQERIANFLDEKTARIDALIAEKERLILALGEWRAAELTRICFGRELPQLKTGNLWIPTLPEGWKPVRLKHLVPGIEQGWSPDCEGRPAEEDEWGILKAGAANAGSYRESENKALPASLEPIQALEVRPGDVLVTRASGTADYVGSFAYVHATRPKLMLSDKNFRLKFGTAPRLLPELLAWTCSTRNLREQILQYVSGADGLAKNIGSGKLKEVWLPVPPLEVQAELIHSLGLRTTQLIGLENHLKGHIDRLREYRSSIISAAVTGQFNLDINTKHEFGELECTSA